MSEPPAKDDRALARLASFAEAHMNEYGGPELLLAVIRARKELGCDPRPDHSDPLGFLEECEKAGYSLNESDRREILAALEEAADE